MAQMVLETNWTSVRLIAVVLFLIRVQFTIFFASFKPMLNEMDDKMDQTVYGYINSLYSVGVAISGPLFGFAANKFGFLRPALITFVIMIVTNIGFIFLWNIPEDRRWYAMGFRFLVGIAAGGSTILNTYWATVARSSDAATAASYTDAALSLGIAFGPLIQLLGSYTYTHEIVIFDFLHVNMYSIPAMIAIVLVLLTSVILYFESASVSTINDDVSWRIPPLNYSAIFLCFAFRALRETVYANIETNNPSVMSWMFNYTDAQTTQVGSAITSGSGFLGFGFLVCYMWTGTAKKVSNRLGVLLGFSVCLLFLLGSFPFSFYYGVIENPTCTFVWCSSTPAIAFPPYVIVYLLLFAVGFPLLNVHTSALLATQLAGRKQAHWHGLSNFIGTASRVAAAPLVGWALEQKGIAFTWYLQIAMVAPVILTAILCYNRLGTPVRLPRLLLFKQMWRKDGVEPEKKHVVE